MPRQHPSLRVSTSSLRLDRFTPTISARGAAAFSPLSISGMRFWQEADAIIGKNTGDTVTTWSDASGASNDFTEASNPPTYRATDGPGGLPCVRFDGTAQTLSKTGLSADTAYTFYIVTKKQSAPSATGKNLFGAIGDKAQIFIDNTGTTTTKYKFYENQAGGATTDLGGDCSAWNIVVVRVNSAASVDFYFNGGSPTNVDPYDVVGIAAITSRYLASSSATGASAHNWGDFDIYGYLEWDSALNATNVNLIANYLAGKTGVSWSDIS